MTQTVQNCFEAFWNETKARHNFRKVIFGLIEDMQHTSTQSTVCFQQTGEGICTSKLSSEQNSESGGFTSGTNQYLRRNSVGVNLSSELWIPATLRLRQNITEHRMKLHNHFSPPCIAPDCSCHYSVYWKTQTKRDRQHKDIAFGKMTS